MSSKIEFIIKDDETEIITDETNIAVLFGDDKNYFETFDKWFNNSL
jgi:hypothetical protein